MFLVRGCNGHQLPNLKSQVGKEGTRAPTEAEARSQVSENAFGDFIEFTTDLRVARGFATGGHLVLVSIERRYLTQGSGTESGWICLREAPFTVLQDEPGRPFV